RGSTPAPGRRLQRRPGGPGPPPRLRRLPVAAPCRATVGKPLLITGLTGARPGAGDALPARWRIRRILGAFCPPVRRVSSKTLWWWPGSQQQRTDEPFDVMRLLRAPGIRNATIERPRAWLSGVHHREVQL